MVSLSEAARALGSVKSEKKAAAVRENGKLGGAPLKPLEKVACNCGGEGMELWPGGVGMLDIVLFLGVLYHLRHPLLALERIFAVTRERLVVETVVDMVGVRRPAAAFYPGRELNADPTNWWGPNVPAVEALLRAAGFTRVRTVTPQRSALYRSARAIHHRLHGRNSLAAAFRQDRAVLHAFR